MNTRALIIAGVILVILVLVPIFTGLIQGASAPDDLSPGWLQALERRRSLTTGDIESSRPARCARQFAAGSITIPQGSDCELTIRSDDSLLPVSREVNIQLEEGNEVDVVVRQPDVVTIRLELEAGDAETFRIFSEGGRIAVLCVQPGSFGTCGIRVSS